jgi:hypothetical protein
MSPAGKYVVADNRLMRLGEELLAGPLLQLEQFCRVLNAADPDDMRVPATVRALIQMTRDCSFAPGARLLADGTPLRMTTPQKGGRPVKPRTTHRAKQRLADGVSA